MIRKINAANKFYQNIRKSDKAEKDGEGGSE